MRISDWSSDVCSSDLKNGKAALLQYAYGSYGHSIDPAFSSTTVSVLDRGMVYASAHIRGGQELGRQWYDDGQLLRKKNTFTDFTVVTAHLVAEGCAPPDRVPYPGGSAGGLMLAENTNRATVRFALLPSTVRVVRGGPT